MVFSFCCTRAMALWQAEGPDPAEGSGPYEAPVDRTPVGRGPCAPPFCALSRRASDCIKCGKCEKACPQHLPIRQLLEQVSQEFDKAR